MMGREFCVGGHFWITHCGLYLESLWRNWDDSLSTKLILSHCLPKKNQKTKQTQKEKPPTQRLPELCTDPIRWEKSHAGCLYFPVWNVETQSGIRMCNLESEYVLTKKVNSVFLWCWTQQWSAEAVPKQVGILKAQDCSAVHTLNTSTIVPPHPPSHTPVFNDYSVSILTFE